MDPKPLHVQPHDYLTGRLHKNDAFTAMRLNDAHHSDIKVGDMVELHGHGDIMDRQKFKVISKMKHPTVSQAINRIEQSGMGIRDKLKLEHTFRGIHGVENSPGAKHEVVSLHLEPHHGTSAFNRNPSLG